MADDRPDDEHPSVAARQWWNTERDRTDEALKNLKALGSTHDIRHVTAAAAMLTAQSNRELGAAFVNAAETIDLQLKSATRLFVAEADVLNSQLTVLATRIDSFNVAADRATHRVAFWTGMLATATFLLVLATAGLVYVAMTEHPQLITVGKP